MRKLTLLVSVLMLLTAGSAYSFNGLRKGFVLGGGLGFSPAAQWQLDDFPVDESKAGVAVNILLGYAWDEFNMIVYEGNVAAYTSDLLFDVSVAQGFSGAVFYHYFGPMGASFFGAAGIGGYSFQVQDEDANDIGLGLIGGVGYEFSRHWQAGLYYSYGKTSNSGIDLTHYHIALVVDVIAF